MPKTSLLPHAALAALLGAAALVAWGGVRMARQESETRVETGREEVSRFAGELSRASMRMEALYEGHMRRIASDARPENTFALKQLGDEIVGVRQIALLFPTSPLSPTNVRSSVTVDIARESVRTRPFFGDGGATDRLPPGVEGVNVTDLIPSRAPGESGWIDQPGLPLLFWAWRDFDELAVLTVEREEVGTALRGWMRGWFTDAFKPVAATGAKVRAGELGGAGTVPNATGPDMLMPVKGRFAAWNIAVWDTREKIVHYEQATLMVAGLVALLLALLGVLVFVFQRRAFRESERRVSFVNRVSHELRSPLTNILLNTDLAAEALEAEALPVAGSRIALIREEAGRLSRLIGNVLTFSRQSEAAPHLADESFSVAECVEATLAPFRPALARRGLGLRFDVATNVFARGDRDAAGQVLGNLVSNVEKYAAEGGELAIHARTDGDEVEIAVTDCGPGIPESARERIFTPFVRLDARVSEGSSGTGLGLAIGRDLAEQMGGSLRVGETAKTGAVFLFRLPLGETVAARKIVPMKRAASQ